VFREPEKETPCVGDLGGCDTRGGDEGKAEIDFASRLRRYGKAKAATLSLAGALGRERLLGMGVRFPLRVVECGDYLKWRDYFTLEGRDRYKLAAASLCGYPLLCGLCARTRAARNLRAYLEKYELVRGLFPECVPHFVTFTVTNGFDLRERLQHLLSCFRLLLDRRHGGKRASSLMCLVVGGVYSVELTNEGKGWHPHIHVLFLAPPGALPISDLAAEWWGITGDSFVVDSRLVAAEPSGVPGVSDYAGGFCEVLKYAMKAAELGPDLVEQAYPVLAGRRLLGSFGCLRGVRQAETGVDDLIGLEDLPFVEFMARYSSGRYALSEV
jgi:hypothetical protein